MTTRTASITPDLIGYMAKARTSPIPSEPVLGQARTRQLMDAIEKLETVASVRDLRPLLRS